jgi:hypothetical protein
LRICTRCNNKRRNNTLAGTQLTITGDLTSLTNSTNVFLVSVNDATNDSTKVSGTVNFRIPVK